MATAITPTSPPRHRLRHHPRHRLRHHLRHCRPHHRRHHHRTTSPSKSPTSPSTSPPTSPSSDIASDLHDIAFDIADIAFDIADIDYDIAFDIAFDIGYDTGFDIDYDISDNRALSKLIFGGDRYYDENTSTNITPGPATLELGMTEADLSNKGLRAGGAIIVAAWISHRDKGALSKLDVRENNIDAKGKSALKKAAGVGIFRSRYVELKHLSFYSSLKYTCFFSFARAQDQASTLARQSHHCTSLPLRGIRPFVRLFAFWAGTTFHLDRGQATVTGGCTGAWRRRLHANCITCVSVAGERGGCMQWRARVTPPA
jgi:hypothetical protein